MSQIKFYNAAMDTELGTVDEVLSCERTEKINSDNTLAFALQLEDNITALVNATNTIKLGDDWFDIAKYTKGQNGGQYPTVTVECEHVSYRLNNAAYNVEYFTEIGTPTYILGKILEGTGFSVGTVEFSGTITFSLQAEASRRGLLMQFIAYVGGEAQFDGFTVSILAQRGSTTPKDLTANNNLTVISKTLDKQTLDDEGNPTVSYECAIYRPVEEIALGDVVTLDYELLDIDVSLRVVSLTTNPYDTDDVKISVGNYINELEDDLYRIETQGIKKDAMMNGVRIGPEYGFEAVRNDKKARAYFKSDGMKFQSGDGTGSTWKDRLYYEYDAELDETVLVFDGALSADVITALSAIITPNLYAGKATIAELTVDQLDTSDKIQNYLVSSTADVNYIKAYDQYIQFITASTDGTSDVQAANRDGELLYWTDETHEAASADETDYPVMMYEYTEAIKAQIAFELEGSNYEPVIVLGQGTSLTETTWGKAYLWKSTTGLTIKYITETGNDVSLFISNDDVIKVTGNTGTGLNIRNIAIGATEPTGAQAGDIWINTGA